ncbi:TonB-dependent receptor [Olivibacter sp. SDN3]|uniref:TonB-dependent receptor plug domain-containing protein n=1 Tax=Olivibacter sp. SDN3 TaxID=2764720 RepID=UPI00165160C5|nr:TonB-dependent receptor [Olivibacter sp. SDN3]QNL48886.1 TonB-dependent receptor [Olivibacter sp. SDN3]
MHWLKRFSFIYFLIISVGVHVSYAQTVMDTVSVYSLQGSRWLKSPTPVQTLTKHQLQRLNSLTVADATRFLSGVQLKDYGGVGGLKTVNIRSMGTNHTQVFLDGLAISNAQNGQVDLGKFSLENIEEITLFNGERPMLLQPARAFASASAMYLTTSSPVFEEGKRTNLRLGIKGGSFGLVNPSILLQHKLTDQTSLSLSTEYTEAHGKYKFRLRDNNYDTTAIRENTDLKAFRIESSLQRSLKNGLWKSQLYLYHADRGLPDATVGNRLKPTSPELGQRQIDRNIFVQSSFSQTYYRYSLEVNLKYANDYTYYANPNIIKLEGPLENNYHQQEAYLSVANQYALSSYWSVGLAGDFIWNKLNADLYNFAYPTRYTTLIAATAKYSNDRLTAQATILSTFLEDKARFFSAAGDKQEVTPSISLSWQPFSDDSFVIRSFYKNIFRMPTFNDLYYTAIGNTLLKPEYANQYDIGFTFRKYYDKYIKYINLQSDIYYNEVSDKIIATPADNQFRWIMYNLERVSIKGADVVVKSGWSVIGNVELDVGLNYTFQEALNTTTRGSMYNKGEQIPYIPKHSGAITLGLNYGSIYMNYSFIYTGERYSQSANTVDNYLQPWYTSDFSLGKDFSLKLGNAKVLLEANNLFNQPYEVVKNFPMPGRNYRIRLAFDY